MSQTRSTLRLIERIDQAQVSGQATILRGNTGDLFVGADGNPAVLRRVLAAWAASQNRGTVCYSPVSGAQPLTPPGHQPVRLPLPQQNLPAGAAIENLLREVRRAEGQPVQVILDWGEHPLPDVGELATAEHDRVVELLADFVTSAQLIERGHRLVVITRVGNLDERLARLPGFVVLDVPHPNHQERLAFINRLLTSQVVEPLLLTEGLGAEDFATITGGLTLDDLHRGRRLSRCGAPIGRSWAQAAKIDTLRRHGTDGPVVYEPGNGLADASGLPQFEYLIRRALQAGRFPRAVMAAGPPGVGKTLLARILGDAMGIPVVGLGNFRSRYVGETERNLSDRLGLIESLSPCVLHIDEIDQAVGRRQEGDSADGGTSERALASLMTFLGDRTRSEHVTVFATTNRPDLLDPAMFDRFTIIPVLHPTPIEAAGILRIAAEREGRTIDEASTIKVLENFGKLLTGRVLVDVLDEAMIAADLDGETTTVGAHHLDQTLADLNMALDEQEHEHLALRAIAMTSFKRYLPWRAARALDKPVYFPNYLWPLLDETGTDLDMARVNARLAVLEGSGGRR